MREAWRSRRGALYSRLMRTSNILPGLLAGVAAILLAASAEAKAVAQKQLQAVFKIHVTVQRADHAQPWQAGLPGSGSGSGFLIDRKRLLTNAHVVSDATFIEVQRHGDSRKYPARVVFAGHDCDLAVLEAEDAELFASLTPLPLGNALPSLGEEVHAIGFPMGGSMLSLTRGVVSRIDMGGYAHSGVDSHLVIQTDAAINPGNSGGPVVLNDKVIGVAFQGMMGGQNIGYAIPLPVIRHFLDDIEDGRYDGYPELGVATLDSRNPALRRALQLPDPERGALVTRVDPFGAAAGRLVPGDMLLAVDGSPVAPDGTVRIGSVSLNFGELVERKQWGESMAFEVWRTGAVARVEFPLDNPPDPFSYRNEYDVLPEYLLAGGLLFVPISRGFLRTLGDSDERRVQPIFYYAQRAKRDGLVGDRRQFVVLGGRLPHAYNTYAAPFVHRIVSEVNGRRVRELADVEDALRTPTNGFHVVRFEGFPLPLVLAAAGQADADGEIAERYGLPGLRRIREREAVGAAHGAAEGES